MRTLIVIALALVVGPPLAAADDDDRWLALAGDPVTDDELAAAKRDKLGCADLATLVDGNNSSKSKTYWKLMAKHCKRDRWPLAIAVCYLRDRGEACYYRLAKAKQRKLERALAKAGPVIDQEERQWAIDAARRAGVLGSTTAPPGGQFASLHGHSPEDDVHDWAQAAYEQCTDRTRALTIEVTIASGTCTGIKISGQRKADAETRCIRALCTGHDFPGVADTTVTAHGRTSP